MCMLCEWEEYMEKIEDMRREERFRRSDDYLYSVLTYVEKTHHITIDQARRINEIERRGGRRR